MFHWTPYDVVPCSILLIGSTILMYLDFWSKVGIKTWYSPLVIGLAGLGSLVGQSLFSESTELLAPSFEGLFLGILGLGWTAFRILCTNTFCLRGEWALPLMFLGGLLVMRSESSFGVIFGCEIGFIAMMGACLSMSLNQKKIEALVKIFLMNLIGLVLGVLGAIFELVRQANDQSGLTISSTMDDRLFIGSQILLCFGFMGKAAVVPLCQWLSDFLEAFGGKKGPLFMILTLLSFLGFYRVLQLQTVWGIDMNVSQAAMIFIVVAHISAHMLASVQVNIYRFVGYWFAAQLSLCALIAIVNGVDHSNGLQEIMMVMILYLVLMSSVIWTLTLGFEAKGINNLTFDDLLGLRVRSIWSFIGLLSFLVFLPCVFFSPGFLALLALTKADFLERFPYAFVLLAFAQMVPTYYGCRIFSAVWRARPSYFLDSEYLPKFKNSDKGILAGTVFFVLAVEIGVLCFHIV